MIIHNDKYWDKYYQSIKKVNQASNFAKFLKKKVLKKKDIVFKVYII